MQLWPSFVRFFIAKNKKKIKMFCIERNKKTRTHNLHLTWLFHLNKIYCSSYEFFFLYILMIKDYIAKVICWRNVSRRNIRYITNIMARTNPSWWKSWKGTMVFLDVFPIKCTKYNVTSLLFYLPHIVLSFSSRIFIPS